MSDLQIAGRLSVERAVPDARLPAAGRSPKGRRGGQVSTQREWRNRAVCRDEDPELFFPVGSDGPALAQTERAKAVCAGCPVQQECLSFALVAITDGVAGGLSAGERRALRDQRRRARAGSPTTTVAGGPDVAERPGFLAPPGVDGLVVTLLVGGWAGGGGRVAGGTGVRGGGVAPRRA